MNATRFIITFIDFACGALVIAALSLVADGWWIAYTGASTLTFGPLQTCVNRICVKNAFSANMFADIPLTCARSSTEQSARFYSVLALAILSGLLSFISGILALFRFKMALLLSGITSISAAAASGVSMGLFYESIDEWIFCDTTFCNYATVSPCFSNTQTVPYILIGIATCLMIAGGLAAIAVHLVPQQQQQPIPAQQDVPTSVVAHENAQHAFTMQSHPEETETAGHPTLGNGPQDVHSIPAAETEPQGVEGPATQQSHADHAENVAIVKDENENDNSDWVWDEESQMYWSDSAGLYLDWDSGWFYDPNSGYWYDPETEQWINAYPEEGDTV